MKYLQQLVVGLILFLNTALSGLLGHPLTTTATSLQSSVISGATTSRTYPPGVKPCKSLPGLNADDVTCTIKKGHVFADDYYVLDKADPATFVSIGYYYGKDAAHVYWIHEGEEGPEPHEIVGADSKTFEVIPGTAMYARDARHVYYLGDFVKNANPASFKVN